MTRLLRSRRCYAVCEDQKQGRCGKSIVQTPAIESVANDVIPLVDAGVYVGQMASFIQEFAEGRWYRYGRTFFSSDVSPGKATVVALESDAPVAWP